MHAKGLGQGGLRVSTFKACTILTASLCGQLSMFHLRYLFLYHFALNNLLILFTDQLLSEIASLWIYADYHFKYLSRMYCSHSSLCSQRHWPRSGFLFRSGIEIRGGYCPIYFQHISGFRLVIFLHWIVTNPDWEQCLPEQYW